MPTYDYRCKNEECRSIHEEFHAMSATPKVVCSPCGSTCTKMISPGQRPIFKGSGFHCNDYPAPLPSSAADYIIEPDGSQTPMRKKNHPDGYRWDS